ncbi:MAG TPA: glycosyltransferase [Conexivisphaerales archaeon]|nr:glycosyltransferase [Conexivisphaerales archaeon]
MKRFLFIGAPFDYASGSFVRTARILPTLAGMVREKTGMEVVLHVPANSIRYVATTLALSEGLPAAYETTRGVVEKALRSMKSAGIQVETQTVEASTSDVISSIMHNEKLYAHGSLFRRLLAFGRIHSGLIEKHERPSIDALTKGLADGAEACTAYSCEGELESLYILRGVARKMPVSSMVMLQSEPYQSRALHLGSMAKGISCMQFDSRARELFEGLMANGSVKQVLSVSPAPLQLSGLTAVARRRGVGLGIPYPANGLDPEVTRARKVSGKGPTAVYFGRLTIEKGALDLLRVWKVVNRLQSDASLKIIGAFESEGQRKTFFALQRSLGLKNIEFLGLQQDRRELFKEVAESRVMLYPSYHDAYPLVVLESVGLGLAVAGYSTPALDYLCKGLPTVSLALPGDVADLGARVVSLLTMDDGKFRENQESPEVARFLDTHTWSNVAAAEMPFLERLAGPSSRRPSR